jgi:MFS family permease
MSQAGGPLSDAIGRRAVLLPAIALGIAGAAIFAVAASTGWLYAARLVQGVALGAASGPVTALIVEREPNADRGRAAMVAALAAVGGVGSGPLLGGVVAQYLPAPTVLAYLVEITLLLCAGVATALLPDPESTNRIAYRPRRPSIPKGGLLLHPWVAGDPRRQPVGSEATGGAAAHALPGSGGQ